MNVRYDPTGKYQAELDQAILQTLAVDFGGKGGKADAEDVTAAVLAKLSGDTRERILLAAVHKATQDYIENNLQRGQDGG